MLKTLGMYVRRTRKVEEPTDIYAHRVKLLEGQELDLSTFRGKPTLIVNTASKCGFTPQFEGLQELYSTYQPQGLQILGCPSGDFAGQELDEAGAIGEFCQRNYGVSFPMTEKMSVRADPHPLWEDLNRQPGSAPPVWNFSKYLVDGDGRLIARWATKTKPTDPAVTAKIEEALASASSSGTTA
jgi:glutathione peroxidase